MPKKVSGPQIMQCHYLKNNIASFGMAAVMTMTSKLTIVTLPIHVIDATDRARKPCSLIDREQPSSILDM
jgi:hypothetical protein